MKPLEWFKAWIRDIASTNLTIVTGLAEGLIYVLWALVADTLGKPITENTLDTVGLFIAAQITGGVVQFATKRRTDDHYVAAKAGSPAAPRQSMARPAQP